MQNRPSSDFEVAIKSLEEKIATLKEVYQYKEFGMLSEVVSGTAALKSALEKKLANDEYDLNQTIEIVSRFLQSVTSNTKPKKITLLNFAAAYCQATVVQCLLNHGAKADEKTIHHATRWNNSDMNIVLQVLKDNHVNFEGLNKKGQTALFVAKRKDHKEAVVALSNHHARMQFSEQVSEPFLRAGDKMSDAANNALMTVFMVPKHHC